jgi:capsular polysaccharide biosynthesis protein
LVSPFVAEIPDVTLVGVHAVPFTSGQKMLLTGFLDTLPELALERHPELEAWCRGERLRWLSGEVGERLRGGPVCSLVGRFDGNYFHWVIDICGQLEALGHYRERAGSEPLVLVRDSAPRFVDESLELLGIERRNVIGWPRHWSAGAPPSDEDRVVASVPRLVVPSWRGVRHTSSPRSLKWLRSRFLAAAREGARAGSGSGDGGGSGSLASRLYIARSSAGWRSVANGEAVEAFLRERGFAVIRPQEHGLAEQIRRFAAAEVIVGMHGAGLTNIVFAPGAHLVELAGSYGMAEYFSICHGLGNGYTRVACPDRGDDLTVDLTALDDALRRIQI